MIKMLLLLGGLFSFFSIHAQEKFPQTWLNKLSVNDSLRLSKERQNALSSYLNTAKQEKKNILLFSKSTRNTKDQDASYIGRLERKDVYTVELSSIVSQYRAETEKNLQILFSVVAMKQWIVFFDEADALFSKTEQPEAIANQIQKLALSNNVLTILWCEDDCLKWLKNSRYVQIPPTP